MPYRRKKSGSFSHISKVKAAKVLQRAFRKRRAGRARIARVPTAGGASLIMPLKCGYQYTLTPSGTTTRVDLDQEVGLQYMLNPDWFNRYHPMFQWIRINKVRIEVTSGVNIGQHGVANSSLYRMYSKKAGTTGETPPNSVNEWLNIQNAKRSVFRGSTNAINYYFTPAFEAPQGATIAKRLMYKRWFEMPSGPTGAVPHIGIIASIVRMDNAVLASTETFNVNVTLYTQCKGVKQL